MKIYAIINVGNEIEGRLTAVKIEKAYKDRSNAETYMNKNRVSYVEDLNLDGQKVQMLCERNIQEIEVED
jgi:hypothetical protein